ncbi:MAG: S1C family serine protease [Oscillospiraceae bacterium]
MNDYYGTNNMQTFSTEGGMAPAPKPPKNKNRHGAAKVVALIAAVAVVGGAAGFGGAYLAGRSGLTADIVSGGDTSSTVSDTLVPAESAPEESVAPTLNELQSGAVQSGAVRKEITGVEYNSDGSYMYTRDLVAAVRDSIVYIEASINYRGTLTPYCTGSGIIISTDGYIITNAHITDDMDGFTVKVTTTDPETNTGVTKDYEAKLIGSDTDTDLAVLKIDAEDLPAAVLGDSDKLSLGDDVVVIGNPLGLESSVTKGIVSGLNRQISSNERSLSSIQTDTAINSGNSGGAMFNMYGEVVGVVNEKLINNYAENVGFAITINEAKDVINDLISKGYVTGRPIIGITCLQVSEYVGAVQGMTPGLYITDIEKNLPVAKSGLVVGDTITAVDGKSVTSVAELTDILNGKKPGDTVVATVSRTDELGRTRNIDIEIELAEFSGT